MSLPIERVITTYEHKKAKNKERYMEALCDRDEDGALNTINKAEEEFERRKAKYKEKAERAKQEMLNSTV